jgi:hypothetical protein
VEEDESDDHLANRPGYHPVHEVPDHAPGVRPDVEGRDPGDETGVSQGEAEGQEEDEAGVEGGGGRRSRTPVSFSLPPRWQMG